MGRADYEDLKNAPSSTIPRPYFPPQKMEQFELNGFCDASNRVYGAGATLLQGSWNNRYGFKST